MSHPHADVYVETHDQCDEFQPATLSGDTTEFRDKMSRDGGCQYH